MNPLVQKALGSALRWLLTISVGAWFVKSGVWTDGQAAEYIGAAAVALAPLVWGLYEKYKSQQKQATTLAVANSLTGRRVTDITEEDIDDVIKSGDSAKAATSKRESPVLTGTGDGISHLRHMVGTGDGR